MDTAKRQASLAAEEAQSALSSGAWAYPITVSSTCSPNTGKQELTKEGYPLPRVPYGYSSVGQYDALTRCRPRAASTLDSNHCQGPDCIGRRRGGNVLPHVLSPGRCSRIRQRASGVRRGSASRPGRIVFHHQLLGPFTAVRQGRRRPLRRGASRPFSRTASGADEIL